MGPNPICIVCRHYHDDGTCAAFPDRIPKPIWNHVHDHRKPYDGDGGIQFEPDPEQDPAKVNNFLSRTDQMRAKFGLD